MFRFRENLMCIPSSGLDLDLFNIPERANTTLALLWLELEHFLYASQQWKFYYAKTELNLNPSF
jgi:hypothetical protein